MNKATRTISAAFGVVFGISGINHGFFETLQGNTATGGLFIPAIGEAQRMWLYGSEYAFTLIPNFLITGIVAMILGLAITSWSVGFIQNKNGPTILILLFVLLLLTGGGIAQILFFPLIWGVSTRINQPLIWWRKVLPIRVRETLAKVWSWALVLCLGLILFVFEIGVFGFVPGIEDPDAVLTFMVYCLGGAYGTLLLAIVAGFANDIVMEPKFVPEEN